MRQASLLEPLAGSAPDPQTGASDEWYTPRWWYDPLAAIFPFELDVCASAESAKCARYYDIYANGLIQPWDRPWFCNPPYSNIPPWIGAALRAARAGVPGVMLLPAWTDREWWQDSIEPIRDLPWLDRTDGSGSGRDAVHIESKFYSRIPFGYPGNPECDRKQLKIDNARWKEEGKKQISGALIYPVALAFIPRSVTSWRGLLRSHNPNRPSARATL